MLYIIAETQWSGNEGEPAVIGTPVQTENWNQARFEFLYKSAYANISGVPYHTIELKEATGERIDIANYKPDRLGQQTGG